MDEGGAIFLVCHFVAPKPILLRLGPPQPSRLLEVDHIDGWITELFGKVCWQG